MAATVASSSQAPLDTRPILRRGASNVWSVLDAACAKVHAAFQQACDQEGIEALVLRSQPFEYPANIAFECWIPARREPALTERSLVVVTVEPKAYHRYEVEYTVRITDRGRNRTYRRLWEFPDTLARGIVRRILRKGAEPRLSRLMLRQYGIDFWRPENKVEALSRDYATIAAAVCGVLGFFTFGLAWLPAIALAIYLHMREAAVRSPGKPEGEPRRLLLCDAWQTVMFGLGADWQAVRDQLLQRLTGDSPVQKCSCKIERIWHRGLDGIEEREQIVLSSGRAMVFCHVYQYGDDLYVGWDGHLNSGQWEENSIAKGIDRKEGRLTIVNSVTPSYQQLTEYDVVDLSCLMEWTHAQLVQVLKKLIAERQIDQEIDFRIVRGDRQGLTRESETGPKIKSVRDISFTNLLSVFKRKA